MSELNFVFPDPREKFILVEEYSGWKLQGRHIKSLPEGRRTKYSLWVENEVATFFVDVESPKVVLIPLGREEEWEELLKYQAVLKAKELIEAGEFGSGETYTYNFADLIEPES